MAARTDVPLVNICVRCSMILMLVLCSIPSVKQFPTNPTKESTARLSCAQQENRTVMSKVSVRWSSDATYAAWATALHAALSLEYCVSPAPRKGPAPRANEEVPWTNALISHPHCNISCTAWHLLPPIQGYCS
eukprot:960114-Amphidinium_carterae.1